MYTRQAQNSNFGARIKAQPEQNPEGKHLPRPVDNTKHLLEHTGQEALALQLQIRRRIPLLFLRGLVAPLPPPPLFLQNDPQPLDKLVQHPSVACTEQQQEGGADTSADDVAHPREAVETVPQRATGRSHDDTGDDDDSAVAQREECTDCDWTLARGNEAPGHEVDGGDVVSVEGVAEAEDEGEGGGGDEGWVKVQQNAGDDPDEYVCGNEEGNDADRRRGKDAEALWEGQGGEGDAEPRHGDDGCGF
ncbi:hypothetical protein CSUB01_07716 [Colletotrichum sublineola]|uniref:Uncharacterized protein n=1 Tax=Colletotrichum sublineola TaxID=1173701 RepID=A0A066X3F3_COLSU|nr:hypothetical protein CSUB01_07716 [Colletotrichum sublineola]